MMWQPDHSVYSPHQLTSFYLFLIKLLSLDLTNWSKPRSEHCLQRFVQWARHDRWFASFVSCSYPDVPIWNHQTTWSLFIAPRSIVKLPCYFLMATQIFNPNPERSQHTLHVKCPYSSLNAFKHSCDFHHLFSMIQFHQSFNRSLITVFHDFFSNKYWLSSTIFPGFNNESSSS